MPVTARKKTGERAAAVADHVPELLLATYHWRYITVPIVRQLFQKTYQAKSDTTTKLHLRTLEQSGYLKATTRSKNDPFIYSVTAKARSLLRQNYPDQTFLNTREETTKPYLINHELAISDFQTKLHQEAIGHSSLAPQDYQRRYFHSANHLRYTDQGEQYRLEPDLSLRIQVTGPEPFSLLHFVEIDMGTESPTAFYNKLRAYSRWYEQAGERYLFDGRHATFRLLVVTRGRRGHHHDRLQTLYQQAQGIPTLVRRTFFTTAEACQNNHLLTDPIWYRLQATPVTASSWLFRQPE